MEEKAISFINPERKKLLFEALLTFTILTILMIVFVYLKFWFLLIVTAVTYHFVSLIFACIIIRDTVKDTMVQNITFLPTIITGIGTEETPAEETITH